MTVDELKCDKCGKHIGWVHEFDLQSSCFYCDECFNDDKDMVERQ